MASTNVDSSLRRCFGDAQARTVLAADGFRQGPWSGSTGYGLSKANVAVSSTPRKCWPRTGAASVPNVNEAAGASLVRSAEHTPGALHVDAIPGVRRSAIQIGRASCRERV